MIKYLSFKKLFFLFIIFLYLVSIKITYLFLLKPLDVQAVEISQECKSVVVLGGSNDYDRILKGLEVAKVNDCPVIFSGTHPKYEKTINVFGLEEVIYEKLSVNTFENVNNTKQLLQKRSIKDICLVTSKAHLYRAKKLFEKNDMHVIPIASNATSTTIKASSFLPDMRYFQNNINILYEYLAIIYYKQKKRF